MSVPHDDSAATQSVVTEPSAKAVGRVMIVWEGGAATRVLPAAGTVTIGRSSDCEVCVEHGSVSRQHASIHVGPKIFIEDLGSANGTKVGGERLARGERRELGGGELVELGQTQLVLTMPSPATSPGPQRSDARSDARSLDIVVGQAMEELYATAHRVASGDLAILLLGETGVGKDVVASRIHAASSRREGPFLAINCAALPEALLESELFGHERGAFTGAQTTKVGLLEAAAGGTVLLDEIGELTVPMQSKLLRALENHEIQRIGALRPRPIDVRFLGATSRDIEALVSSGQFRADLYYRVSGAILRVPPLRERRDEIVPLARRFALAAAERAGRPAPSLAARTQKLLEGHEWPGNIRELRNVVERAALTSARPEIAPEDLVFDTIGPRSSRSLPVPTSSLVPPSSSIRPSAPAPLRNEVEALERKRILEALEQFGGNQTRAAKALGISRRTLLSRLDEYGVPRPRK